MPHAACGLRGGLWLDFERSWGVPRRCAAMAVVRVSPRCGRGDARCTGSGGISTGCAVCMVAHRILMCMYVVSDDCQHSRLARHDTAGYAQIAGYRSWRSFESRESREPRETETTNEKDKSGGECDRMRVKPDRPPSRTPPYTARRRGTHATSIHRTTAAHAHVTLARRLISAHRHTRHSDRRNARHLETIQNTEITP